VVPRLETLEDRTVPSGYQQINLVGEQPGMAPRTDPNLNGWGMDYAPNGPFAVADNGFGLVTLYDANGKMLPQKVTIPAPPGQPPGPDSTVRGLVYNATSEFVISEDGRSAPAEFLFCSKSGTISGWSGNALGGAIENLDNTPKPGLHIARLTVSYCRLTGNEALGGAGSTGGNGAGGAIANQDGAALTVLHTLLVGNLARGGNGGLDGNGGDGLGGGLYISGGSLQLEHTRITDNHAVGGHGGAGGHDGHGVGGGLYVVAAVSACADDATVIVDNLASTSDDDIFGVVGKC
jgi:hypothetical protein